MPPQQMPAQPQRARPVGRIGRFRAAAPMLVNGYAAKRQAIVAALPLYRGGIINARGITHIATTFRGTEVASIRRWTPEAIQALNQTEVTVGRMVNTATQISGEQCRGRFLMEMVISVHTSFPSISRALDVITEKSLQQQLQRELQMSQEVQVQQLQMQLEEHMQVQVREHRPVQQIQRRSGRIVHTGPEVDMVLDAVERRPRGGRRVVSEGQMQLHLGYLVTLMTKHGVQPVVPALEGVAAVAKSPVHSMAPMAKHIARIRAATAWPAFELTLPEWLVVQRSFTVTAWRQVEKDAALLARVKRILAHRRLPIMYSDLLMYCGRVGVDMIGVALIDACYTLYGNESVGMLFAIARDYCTAIGFTRHTLVAYPLAPARMPPADNTAVCRKHTLEFAESIFVPFERLALQGYQSTDVDDQAVIASTSACAALGLVPSYTCADARYDDYMVSHITRKPPYNGRGHVLSFGGLYVSTPQVRDINTATEREAIFFCAWRVPPTADIARLRVQIGHWSRWAYMQANRRLFVTMDLKDSSFWFGCWGDRIHATFWMQVGRLREEGKTTTGGIPAFDGW